MVYFLEVNTDKKKDTLILIRYEEGSVCQRYDYNNKRWVTDYKTFGKMCIGSIPAEVITEQEAKNIIEREMKQKRD